MEIDYSQKSAVIVCHDWMYGPPHELRDFLLKHNIGNVLFIGHKNQYIKNNSIQASYYEYYFRGKKKNYYTNPLGTPEYFTYVIDMIRTIYWSLHVIRKPIDYFIGVGNLNAFAGIILQALGKISRTYYYVIDYVPNRFKNPIINSIYHVIDKWCALYSNCTWNYAKKMIKEREKKWKRIFPRQIVVPNGIHIREENIVSAKKMHTNELIYMGTLFDYQGLQMVIKSLPYIKNSIPNIRLAIIGEGPYKQDLIKIAKQNNVLDRITFLGYISDPIKMEKRLSYAALGVATYDPHGGFVSYTEPGKVKRYLSCGVPVIMTDINPIAQELIRNQCGLVVPYNIKHIAQTIITFLKDQKRMMVYRVNATSYASGFVWDTIFSHAFASSV